MITKLINLDIPYEYQSTKVQSLIPEDTYNAVKSIIIKDYRALILAQSQRGHQTTQDE